MGYTTYGFYCNSTDILQVCYRNLWDLQPTASTAVLQIYYRYAIEIYGIYNLQLLL